MMIDLDNIDSDNVTFFSDGMNLVTVDLNNINLVNDNFDKDDPTNIVLVTLIAWCNKLKQYKACKKR